MAYFAAIPKNLDMEDRSIYVYTKICEWSWLVTKTSVGPTEHEAVTEENLTSNAMVISSDQYS
jgi:hypothetical protein